MRIQSGAAVPYPPVSQQTIKDYKNKVDDLIKKGEWDQMEVRTFNFMPNFIARANRKDPDLQAYFLPRGIQELSEKIDSLRRAGKTCARFVVNVGEVQGTMAYHFAAFDYQAGLGDRGSLIGLDSALIVDPKLGLPYLEKMNPSNWMLAALEGDFKRRLPDTAVVFMEGDIQKSAADCGMFALAFVKKMSQEKSKLEDIHRRNIAGELGDTVRIGAREVYKLLPPSFLKHAHARSTALLFRQLHGATDTQTASAGAENTRQSPAHPHPTQAGTEQSLESRQQQYLVSRTEHGSERVFSRSIEFKTKKEIDKLLVPSWWNFFS